MSNTGFDLTTEVLEGMAVGYLGSDPGLPVPPLDLGWESKQLIHSYPNENAFPNSPLSPQSVIDCSPAIH